MNIVLKTAMAWALLGLTIAMAQETRTIESLRSASDFGLTADPEAPHWRTVRGVFTERDQRGELVPGHRTEIRSRWTGRNLYLLFICPYEELNLIAKPSTTTETDKLWEWDVAEAFIGTDFKNIKHYTEFQVSPQGEWVDLDIDRSTDPPNHNVGWNSGYKVKARLDPARKIWYGEMSIPMAKIDQRAAAVGNTMRINFYRIQGPGGSGGSGPRRKHIAWQPTNSPTYHVPESFGTLKLIK
ncbi:MAG: carbohydrate-binding family 9-like protein [Acidobacteriota bacterium]|jgi:hypothetical protein